MDKLNEQIDGLIWQVAESGDDAARADFELRYPEHRAALATRVAMVDVLRAAKPVSPIPTRFVPARKPASRRWLVLAPLAAGLLIGVALAAFQIGKMSGSPEGPANPEPAPNYVSPTPTPRENNSVAPPINAGPNLGTAPRDTIQPADTGMVVLPIETSLFAALSAVRDKGVKVEIMPGVEDKGITLQPNRDDGTLALEPAAMLQAIKAAAGVEVVDAGPDGYLVLPSERTTITDPNRVRPEDIGN